MIVLFFISLAIASKWKGSLTKCGFIGMAIYCLVNMVAAGSAYRAGEALGSSLVLSLFVIWIPVWIVMFRRRSKSAGRALAEKKEGQP